MYVRVYVALRPTFANKSAETCPAWGGLHLSFSAHDARALLEWKVVSNRILFVAWREHFILPSSERPAAPLSQSPISPSRVKKTPSTHRGAVSVSPSSRPSHGRAAITYDALLRPTKPRPAAVQRPLQPNPASAATSTLLALASHHLQPQPSPPVASNQNRHHGSSQD